MTSEPDGPATIDPATLDDELEETKTAGQRWLWLLPVLGVLAIAVISYETLNELNTNVAGVSVPARGPVGAITSQREKLTVVPTSGSRLPAEVDAAVDTATIREIETITGQPDARQLIGMRVELRVPVQKVTSSYAFWVGPRDNQLFVVLRHDTRTLSERQQGRPPTHHLSSADVGQTAVVTGTIQRVPSPEYQTWSWEMTAAERKELAERGIYIRADSVTNESGPS